MEVVAGFGEGMLRCFPLEVPQLVHAAPLHGGPRPHQAHRAAQPGIAVDDAQHRRPEPARGEIVLNTREFRGGIWAPRNFRDDYGGISWHGRARIERQMRRLGVVIIEPPNFVAPPRN